MGTHICSGSSILHKRHLFHNNVRTIEQLFAKFNFLAQLAMFILLTSVVELYGKGKLLFFHRSSSGHALLLQSSSGQEY